MATVFTPRRGRSAGDDPASHRGVCVSDVGESLRFYRDGIGLEVLIASPWSVSPRLEPLFGTPYVATPALDHDSDVR